MQESEVRINSLQALAFKESLPFMGRDLHGKGYNRASGAARGHHYLAVGKIGRVHLMSNWRPHTDYPVNPLWVTQMVSAKKITYDVAHEEYINCVSNLEFNLRNLARLRLERDMKEIEAKEGRLAVTLAKDLAPRVYLPVVEEEWLGQFQVERYRYKFLVLEGPSQRGKTCYLRQLFGPKLYVCNCSAALEPDLRYYDHHIHDAILFDEASAVLVLRAKLLFQSPSQRVEMGTSATNCHAYHVFVHRTKMVVASNTWTEDLQRLSPAGRAWLEANSVVVQVERDLWETPAAPARVPKTGASRSSA